MIDNGGIAAAKDYPYMMADGWCRANTTQVALSPVDYHVFLGVTERAMRYALANVGPVAVAFDASHPSIVFYSSGEDGVWPMTSPTSPIFLPLTSHSTKLHRRTGCPYAYDWIGEEEVGGICWLSGGRQNGCGVLLLRPWARRL